MAQTVTTINELMFVSELSRLNFRTDNPDCTFAIVRTFLSKVLRSLKFSLNFAVLTNTGRCLLR